MSTKLKRIIIEELKQGLRSQYGSKLQKLVLYGSFARGDADENSDIDVLVVLKENISPGKEIDKMMDVIFNLSLKYDTLISVYPVSQEEYRNRKSPLLLNIRREGITL